MNFQILFWVFLGGGLGSLSRFLTGKFVSSLVPSSFPAGTLIANSLACLIVGLSLYFFKEKLVQQEWLRYLIIVGFCGGFSTFSAFGLETIQLIQNQAIGLALLNVVLSLTIGFTILYLLLR